jgi:uncharacterized protein (TIGR01777 family)
MRVLVAGSTGIIGSAVKAALEERGHEVVRLVRPETGAEGIPWDPPRGQLDPAEISGFDAVVNLGGRSIGERRWTNRERALVWSSRVEPTSVLARAIRSADQPPAVLINASAVGYYGDTGDEVATEDHPAGDGFLAELCVAWEAAAGDAAAAGTRVVMLRTGVVVTARGGLIARLLAPLGPKWFSPFRWGLGGVVGRGKPWLPWVSTRDQVRAILHLLEADVHGPVNVVSPTQVRHREFMKSFGRALHRPIWLPIPPLLIRLLFGSELARALVTQGQRAEPRKLRESGFEFEDTDLDAVMRDALESA